MGGRVISERPAAWENFLRTARYSLLLSTCRRRNRCESRKLIYGTLRVEESPHFRHQNLLLELAVLMRVFVGQHKLGVVCIAPQDVILDPARALILQPDLMFISKQRQEIISDHIWGAPDLVVEVMSPHPRIGKLDERIRHFAQYGVKECWLVHQLSREKSKSFGCGNSADGHRRTFRGVQAIKSAVLPEFRISPEVLSCW